MSSLSPAVVAAIDDLELSARLIVEGLRTGGHRSPFHGFSTEFRQHRPYRAGDDLKHLDWKLFGRSDRLYSRQFRETTNVSIMLVIDTSASMGFPNNSSQPSKLRYAAIVAAALAHLAIAQGHAVGLMTTAAQSGVMLKARGGRPHLRALIAQLDGVKAEGRWDGARAMSLGAQLLQRRGLMIVLSDFYDNEEGVQRELRHIAQHGHDVIAMQVLSAEERSLAGTAAVEFEDLETGERRMADVQAISAEYAQSVAAFVERTRQSAASAGIDHVLLPTEQPPEIILRDYLRQRSLAGGSIGPLGLGRR
jgi:uncharacterized protein (DUF58 family)